MLFVLIQYLFFTFIFSFIFLGKYTLKIRRTLIGHLNKIQYSEIEVSVTHKICKLSNCLLKIVLNVWKLNLFIKFSNICPSKPVTRFTCAALQLRVNGLKQASGQETNIFSGKIAQQPRKSITLKLSSKACIRKVWLLSLKESLHFSRAAYYRVRY